MDLQTLYKSLKTQIDDRDARLIIAHVAGMSDADFISRPDTEVSAVHIEEIHSLTHRRIQGEPVSKIIGIRYFWDLEFIVTPDVLDPRPDTETLIETALKTPEPQTILDIGTGSGCLIITLLSQWTKARGVAVDMSTAALSVAHQNAQKHGVLDRLDLMESDLDNSVDGSVQFDLIISNPPYIPESDIANLAPEVKNHDPILALDGGIDGLDFYRRLIPLLKKRLKQGGKAFFEIGINQDEAVTRLVEDSGLILDSVYPDLAGIPRVVEISLGKTKKNIAD